MAYKCDNCDKGKIYGHMVSHAKNRLGRIFKPNLQKLKVLKNGVMVRVKFCTGCIKRLNKDGRMGSFALVGNAVSGGKSNLPVQSVIKTMAKESAAKKVKEVEVKAEKARETIDISAIVGKKS